MKPLRLAVPLLLLAAPLSASAEVEVLSFDAVHSGMRGVGRTVFAGTEVIEFDVEIVGKLEKIGPDQNLILGRLSGGPLADTGVLSGMSGSPVMVDGKLIGAVAYSWGFAKEALAGITPIEEMLAVARLDAPPSPRVGSLQLDRSWRSPLDSDAALRAFFLDELQPAVEHPQGALPLAVPLSVAGVGARGLGAIAPWLERAGFLPLQSGGARRGGASPPLEPGSAIGVQLVRGDVEMTATGTVTWVDGDRVLAFGHPLFGLGAIDLPLTGATVETLLPSVMQSARIASALGEIGAVRQDRAAAIFGRLGAKPGMIPVRFRLSHPQRPEKVFSFDVADDPLLSPLLLYVSLNGILASRERTLGSVTVRIGEGSVIKMARGEDVQLDNLYAGPAAFNYGTGIPAYILYLLMNNAWSRPEIAGINLILEYDDRPRSGHIERATLDRYRVKAGEEVEATVVLAPFRGADRILTRKLLVPEEVLPGTLTLWIGGALAVSRAEQADEQALPRDLEQLVRLINQLRRNNRIYLAATREDNGLLLDGIRMPSLPPSASYILTRPRRAGHSARLSRRTVLEDSITTDQAVEGAVRIELEVVAP